MPRSPLACVFVATLGLALGSTPISALELRPVGFRQHPKRA